jgi:alpha-beta hydrolase superfamily lysophospholipase
MSATIGTYTASDEVELHTRSWTIADPRYDILLVHGLGEHSGRWNHVAEYLNSRGANVYSYDVRGHGESGGDRVDLSHFVQLHRDISEMALRTAASTGRPWVLYGHSLGGLQCAGYLIDHTEPMPNVAVLSAPAMVTTRGIDRVLKVASSVLGRITPTTRVENKITAEQLSKDPAVGEAYFADPLVETKATVRFGKACFAEQDRLVGHAGEIDIPTLVIHGADDPLVEPQASASLATSPSVERKVYPGIRHELHNEPEAEQVLGDIADWIDRKLFAAIP